VKVPLRKHLAGVEAFARDFATRVQLPLDRVSDLALAGAWHDAGKADPRFQVMLHGGSRFLADVAEEPLAKSSTPANDRVARQAAWRASGYPRGARHELASVALMLTSKRIRESAKDLDLVLHLVASHHGWCRPLAPVVEDPSPVDVPFEKEGEQLRVSSVTHLERLDSGVSERFWTLVRRYGWFGLAWMEAILRLADHRRSEAEQMEEADE
jgi:CRISPR-associated endonuclease/helicase Cas3